MSRQFRLLRRSLLGLASGGLLWLSCPSGTVEFLARAAQPAIGEVLSNVAATLSDSITQTITGP